MYVARAKLSVTHRAALDGAGRPSWRRARAQVKAGTIARFYSGNGRPFVSTAHGSTARPIRNTALMVMPA